MTIQNDCSGPCQACLGWHDFGKDGKIVKENNCHVGRGVDGFLPASQEQLKLRVKFEPKFKDEVSEFIDEEEPYEET